MTQNCEISPNRINDLENTLMAQNRLITPEMFSLSVHSPALLESGANIPALRFSLTVSNEELGDFFTIPGWRIINGKLAAPARKAGRGWAAVCQINNARFTQTLVKMVQEWAEEFPSVVFPVLTELEDGEAA